MDRLTEDNPSVSVDRMTDDEVARALLALMNDIDAMREAQQRVEVQFRALAGRYGVSVSVADPGEIADSDVDAFEERRESAVILDFQRRRE